MSYKNTPPAPAGYRFLIQCFGMTAEESMAYIKRAFGSARQWPVVLKAGVWLSSGNDSRRRCDTWAPNGGFTVFVEDKHGN